MNRHVQKSYNWAYGAVKGSARMLPFLVRDVQRKPLREAGKHIREFERRLHFAVDEFRTLEAHLDAPLFGGAAMGVEEACGLLLEAVAESEAGRENDGRSKIRLAASKLSRVTMLLDAQSPIPFKLWFLNPWRYY
ncbi:MAG TPA: hypothetical protein VG820_03770, partial [Fimbriimonadaceae bacterium]|nr:hypothetical protein [Fimbriimonadaceae bacterium]